MQLIYYLLFLIYLTVTLTIGLLKNAEIVLEKMQRKSTKLLKSKWPKSRTNFMAKCCILASALYSNPDSFLYIKCFKRVSLLHARSYLGETRNIGYIANCTVRGKKFDIIALRSTVCISDMLCTQDKELVYTKYGGVHRGYYNQAMDIIRIIPKTCKNVMITGHSLGGSLGIMIGFILSNNSKINVSVYTFGSPKTGDVLFCSKIIQRNNFKVHNIVNLDDKLCHLPSMYDRVGTVHEINYNTGSYMKNHSIYSYMCISNKEPAVLTYKRSYIELILFNIIQLFV
jgi:triacylglycerol lipase